MASPFLSINSSALPPSEVIRSQVFSVAAMLSIKSLSAEPGGGVDGVDGPAGGEGERVVTAIRSFGIDGGRGEGCWAFRLGGAF